MTESTLRKNPRSDGQPFEPWEGNGPCQDCGGPNVNWWTYSSVWNQVVGDETGLVLCVTCFVRRAYRAGLDPTAWRLVPEFGENVDYWLTRADERDRLRRDGHLRGEPEPLPVSGDRPEDDWMGAASAATQEPGEGLLVVSSSDRAARTFAFVKVTREQAAELRDRLDAALRE